MRRCSVGERQPGLPAPWVIPADRPPIVQGMGVPANHSITEHSGYGPNPEGSCIRFAGDLGLVNRVVPLIMQQLPEVIRSAAS